MVARVGDVVRIAPYDYGEQEQPGPEEGDIIGTYSERTETFGTAYLILESRLMTRSIHPGRYDLRCRVLGPAGRETVPSGARAFTIVWSSRARRRSRR